MWRIVVLWSVFGWAQAHFGHYPHNQPFDPQDRPSPLQRNYRLCTDTQQAYDKCVSTLQAAEGSSVPLPLKCLPMDSVDACVSAVRNQTADMLVLDEHGYKAARMQRLEPILYARESGDSLYVAVAPRNIGLVDLKIAALRFTDVDEDNTRALHAAVFFDLHRGHDICSMMSNATGGASIKIVDSARYTPTADEILICPDRGYAEFQDFRSCNIEARLQRAVFVPRHTANNRFAVRSVRRIFDTILQHFSAQSSEDAETEQQQFNFFDTFDGVDDVIFANDTVAFDTKPLIRNGVNEQLFNYLHCNKASQDHDLIVED